jgi:hypothetical protein
MSNILIAHHNLVNSATLSGGSWEANYPITNLQTDKLGEVARTLNDNNVTITATFGVDKTIGCVALANHNLSVDGRVGITVKDSLGNILDSPTGGNLAPYIDSDRNTLLCWFMNANLSNIRSVNITLADINNPSNYFTIGRLFIGRYYQPSVNVEFGDASHGRIDLSDNKKSINGVKWHRDRAKLRTASIGLNHLSETEMLDVDNIIQYSGTTNEVIYAFKRPDYIINNGLIQDELSYKRTFIANLSTLDALNSPFLNRYSAQLNFEEIAI